MATQLYQPTASQWAAAAMHLDRRDEWRFFRRAGIRYVSILSGRSNHLYVVRADAKSCSCPWNERMWQQCSHMLAQELAAMEDELIEARNEDIDNEIELAFMALATSKRGNGAGAAVKLRYEDIFGEED